MDLTTQYLGFKLRTPLVAAASPLSEDVDGIRRMEDAGCSAVVLHSLFEEQLRQERLELNQKLEQGTESFPEALTYFPEPEEFTLGPEEYLKHIAKAKRAVKIPVIASLNASSPGGWTQYAKLIQQAGADALELNIYHIPTNLKQTGAEVEQTYLDILTAVKAQVSIPVAVKVSPFFSNFANMAALFEAAGADGLGEQGYAQAQQADDDQPEHPQGQGDRRVGRGRGCRGRARCPGRAQEGAGGTEQGEDAGGRSASHDARTETE